MKCFFTQSYGNIVKKGWAGDLRRNKTEARMSPIHVSGGSKAVFPLASLVTGSSSENGFSAVLSVN